jgi:hypothetical protein
VFGALFVKILYYFHFLLRCNRFAFFSTVFFNSSAIRNEEAFYRENFNQGDVLLGIPVLGPLLHIMRYMVENGQMFVTVKLQNLGEEPSSVSGSMTKRSWPICITHFGTENELTWDVLL